MEQGRAGWTVASAASVGAAVPDGTQNGGAGASGRRIARALRLRDRACVDDAGDARALRQGRRNPVGAVDRRYCQAWELAAAARLLRLRRAQAADVLLAWIDLAVAARRADYADRGAVAVAGRGRERRRAGDGLGGGGSRRRRRMARVSVSCRQLWFRGACECRPDRHGDDAVLVRRVAGDARAVKWRLGTRGAARGRYVARAWRAHERPGRDRTGGLGS